MKTDEKVPDNTSSVLRLECANCGGSLTGPYCQTCGQRVIQDRDFSLWRLARDWTAATFSVDSRGLVTLHRLLFRPGRLTVDHLAGRRGAVFGPFQIFVLVTLAFFLLPDNYDIFQSPARWLFDDARSLVEAKTAALEMSETELAILYDAKVGTYSKLGLVVIVVVLAFVSWIVGQVKHPEYGKHLVMIVHNFCFVLTMFLLLVVVATPMAMIGPQNMVRPAFELATIVWVFGYFTLSQRRVLQIGWMRAVVHAALLVAAFFVAVTAYRGAISHLTLLIL